MRVEGQLGLGRLYSAVSSSVVNPVEVLSDTFDLGTFGLSGNALPIQGAGVTGYSGPMAAADSARATFQNASDRFIELGNRWAPIPVAGYNPLARIPLPDAEPGMLTAEGNTVREASALLHLGGVAHAWNKEAAALEISPSADTHLGRFAALLSQLGTRLLYCPAMLWNQKSVASFNAGGFMFLSNEAIAAGQPGGPEAHETIHALLNHLFHQCGQYHPFLPRLMPTPGHRLFEDGDYVDGFTMEELLTTACDLAADCGIDAQLFGMEIGAAPDAERVKAGIDRHARGFDRGRMARTTRDTVEGLLARLKGSSFDFFEKRPSEYYVEARSVVQVGDRTIYPQRIVLAAAHDLDPELQVELTSYQLSQRDQRVVAVLIRDEASQKQIELPVLNPGALEAFDRAMAGDEVGDAFSQIIDHIVRPQLSSLARFAGAQADAYDALTQPGTPAAEGLTALAQTLAFDVNVTEPGADWRPS